MNGPRSPWDATGRMKFAGQRPMQTHNSQSWENAVGGTRNSVRAIYGSTDRAREDHRNDTLCRIKENVIAVSEPRASDPTWVGYTDTTPVVPTSEEVAKWVARAQARNMTLVAYLAKIGRTL